MEKAIDRIALQAEKELAKLIAEARAKYVVPFCDKHGCRFSAGMGSWSFHGGDLPHGGYWDEGYLSGSAAERIPKRLYAVLSAEYPLNRNNDCGSLMESYTPANYRD